MKMKNLSRRIWMARLSLTAAGGLLLAGCSGSKDKATEDNAAADVRGEPINPSTSATTQPATAASTPPPSPTQAASAPAVSSTPVTADNTPNTNAAVVSAPKNEAATENKEGDFLPVTFDRLASFKFEMPEDQVGTNQVVNATKSDEQIPGEIKALDQKPVALKGFMLPLKVESGLVTEMLIMRDQSMCCYGTVPKINEWVSVKMDKGVKAVMDQPVTIYGKLRVGEMRENGYLVGIYQLDGQKMAGPLDL